MSANATEDEMLLQGAFAQGYHYGQTQPAVTKHLAVEAKTRFGYSDALQSAFTKGFHAAIERKV